MTYISYLLRLWRVDGESSPLWRASLQQPGTVEVLSFAGLEALVAFLQAEMVKEAVPEPLERAQAPPSAES